MWVNGINLDPAVCVQQAEGWSVVALTPSGGGNGVEVTMDITAPLFTSATGTDMQSFVDNLVETVGYPWFKIGSVFAVNLHWASQIVDDGELQFGGLAGSVSSGGYAPYADGAAALAAIAAITGNVTVTS
jgi:hypothetical protein